jgi:hypothetical protein
MEELKHFNENAFAEADKRLAKIPTPVEISAPLLTNNSLPFPI